MSDYNEFQLTEGETKALRYMLNATRDAMENIEVLTDDERAIWKSMNSLEFKLIAKNL